MVQSRELAFIRYSQQAVDYRDWLSIAVNEALWPLNAEYPFFAIWYKNLFSASLTLDNDREILLCLDNKRVAGVAILKYSEQKVCTLRVSKGYRGRSIGTRLLTNSFELLDTSRPLITVRSTRLKEYQRLFERFGFRMEDRRYAYYSLLHSECAFNGILDERAPLLNTIEFLQAREHISGNELYRPSPRAQGSSPSFDSLALA